MGTFSKGNVPLDSQGRDGAAVRVEMGSKAGAETEGGEKSVVEAGTSLGEEAATRGLWANSVI